jgi:TonB family protein
MNVKRAVGVICGLLLISTIAAAQATISQVYTGKDKGVVPPKVVKEVKPHYTTAARDAKIQGRVEVAAVVQSDGSLGEVRVTRSLDQKYGLDEEAVKAVKQWQFEPGTKDGKPVAVEVTIELTFTLK